MKSHEIYSEISKRLELTDLTTLQKMEVRAIIGDVLNQSIEKSINEIINRP